MSTDPQTLAFLHAHGLDVQPKSLAATLREAVDTLSTVYLGPGDGLTEAEAKVASAGGLDPAIAHGAGDPLVTGVVTYAGLLHTALATRDVARRLGVSEARIRQRIAEGTLVALRIGRTWCLPIFQFAPRGAELPGWGVVCRALPPAISPVAVERWLRLPHPDLHVGKDDQPTSPRDWLLGGRNADAVAELAGELG